MSVNEAGLAGGSTATTDDPTNTQDASETATGSFKIETGEDTVGHVYVTDKDNHQIDVTNAGTAGIVVHGQYGDLTVTYSGEAYSYSYTLADKTSGDTAHESFAVQVVDSDGDPQSTTLVIDIVDDILRFRRVAGIYQHSLSVWHYDQNRIAVHWPNVENLDLQLAA